MGVMARSVGVLVLGLVGLAVPAVAAERVAYFGVHFLNTSLEPTQAAEEARLAAAESQIREALAGSGRYVFVDTAPVASKARLYSNLAQCNGCDTALAAELGADLALSGEIQKTSNLILHISIYLRDAATGALVTGGSADIRGNTDRSWERGIDYLLRNRILTE